MLFPHTLLLTVLVPLHAGLSPGQGLLQEGEAEQQELPAGNRMNEKGPRDFQRPGPAWATGVISKAVGAALAPVPVLS